MRTTLDLDEDVLQAIRELARRERRPMGQVASGLLRQALTQGATPATEAGEGRASYGFRPFRSRQGLVTNAVIDELRDEEGA